MQKICCPTLTRRPLRSCVAIIGVTTKLALPVAHKRLVKPGSQRPNGGENRVAVRMCGGSANMKKKKEKLPRAFFFLLHGLPARFSFVLIGFEVEL